jgi:hypothetical protein
VSPSHAGKRGSLSESATSSASRLTSGRDPSDRDHHEAGRARGLHPCRSVLHRHAVGRLGPQALDRGGIQIGCRLGRRNSRGLVEKEVEELLAQTLRSGGLTQKRAELLSGSRDARSERPSLLFGAKPQPVTLEEGAA